MKKAYLINPKLTSAESPIKNIYHLLSKYRHVASVLSESGILAVSPFLITASVYDYTNEKETERFVEMVKSGRQLKNACDISIQVEVEGYEIDEFDNLECANLENFPILSSKFEGDITNPEFYFKYPHLEESVHAELGNVRRKLLRKNEDYTSASIMATGTIGVGVRMVEKVFRMMNFLGFQVNVSGMNFAPPTKGDENFESLEETFFDLIGYSVIGRMLSLGSWKGDE